MKKQFILIIIALLSITHIYSAIELVTVPKKEDVQLTIYNSADVTLVKEKRILTFRKGMNRIQFAWANTLIDPTSLRLSFINNKKNFELLDTAYPANRKDVLQWNIVSKKDISAKIQITYFTSGITWKADYRAIASIDDTKMNLTGYVKIINRSGEDYSNASVRLIVGTIHLVESIKSLAQKGRIYSELEEDERKIVRRKYKRYIKKAEKMRDFSYRNGRRHSHKKIIKEGLSEYFIFTIPGKESIPNKWEKKLLSVQAKNISLDTIYRFSNYSSRNTISYAKKYYEFKNRKSNGIISDTDFGKTPLPDGWVYIYKKNNSKKENLKYINSFQLKYVAIDDKIKLYAGKEFKVSVHNQLKNYKRKNISVKNNFYQKPYVDSHIEEFSYEEKIISQLKRTIKVEINRNFYGNYKIYANNTKFFKKSKTKIQFFPKIKSKSLFIVKYKIDIFHGDKYKK